MQDNRYPGGYNGWTNKETWTVHLWVTNDPGTYDAARAAAQRGEEVLKDFVEDLCGLNDASKPASLATDLLSTGLAWVDWNQLRKALLEA